MLRRGGTPKNITLDEKRRARRSRSSRIPLGELAGTATSADTDARWWLHGCGEREMRGEETESRGKNRGQQGTGGNCRRRVPAWATGARLRRASGAPALADGYLITAWEGHFLSASCVGGPHRERGLLLATAAPRPREDTPSPTPVSSSNYETQCILPVLSHHATRRLRKQLPFRTGRVKSYFIAHF